MTASRCAMRIRHLTDAGNAATWSPPSISPRSRRRNRQPPLDPAAPGLRQPTTDTGRHANPGNVATAAAKPQFLTVCEAATLLNVNERTVRRWIDAESIPYLDLPGGSYRIPQGAEILHAW